MEPFFAGLAPTTVMEMADLSRRMYTLREERKLWLTDIGFEDSDELLAAIADGKVAEHPAYEIWLASQLSGEQLETLRVQLDWRCRNPVGETQNTESAHPMDAIALTLDLPDNFEQEFSLPADGLGLRSADGVDVLLRVVSSQHWSVEWQHGERRWRLDTAPVAHAGVDTHAHLHRPDGSVVADPLALSKDLEPAAIVHHIVDALGRSFDW